MSKYEWLFNERIPGGGRVCNVTNMKGINYKDFVRAFGEPDKVVDDEFTSYREWQFQTPSGENFDIYYDSSNFVINKIQREKLKSHGRVKIEEVDELTIQGSIKQIALLKTFLHYEFGTEELSAVYKTRAFEYIFRKRR